jgi:PEGA domain
VRSRVLVLAIVISSLVAGCSSTDEGDKDFPAVRSVFESDPEGASIYVDGFHVGVTPTSFTLPDKNEVEIRVDLPNHFPRTEKLLRAVGVPPNAAEGAGWEELYYWNLERRR